MYIYYYFYLLLTPCLLDITHACSLKLRLYMTLYVIVVKYIIFKAHSLLILSFTVCTSWYFPLTHLQLTVAALSWSCRPLNKVMHLILVSCESSCMFRVVDRKVMWGLLVSMQTDDTSEGGSSDVHFPPCECL